jgi:GH24 family phage-related lysozyme (muramidase)
MHQAVRPKLRDYVEQWEGVVLWMYRDNVGRVTTGIGFLLESASAASWYRWVHKQSPGGGVVGAEAAAAEWRAVQSHNATGADPFERITQLRLAEGEVDRGFERKTAHFEQRLRVQFPEWDTYPGDAQLGMLVHAYGVGPNVASGWPRYTAACRRHDWETASVQCLTEDLRRASAARLVKRRASWQRMFHNAACVEAALHHVEDSLALRFDRHPFDPAPAVSQSVREALLGEVHYPFPAPTPSQLVRSQRPQTTAFSVRHPRFSR